MANASTWGMCQSELMLPVTEIQLKLAEAKRGMYSLTESKRRFDDQTEERQEAAGPQKDGNQNWKRTSSLHLSSLILSAGTSFPLTCRPAPQYGMQRRGQVLLALTTLALHCGESLETPFQLHLKNFRPKICLG